MDIAACVTEECGEAIENAYSLIAQARIEYFSDLWMQNRGSCMQLMPIIVLIAPLTFQRSGVK